MVKVKICGIKNENDLKLAINEGYHAIGAVIDVEKSPRNISQQKADELFSKIPPFITSVAVIVPKSIDDILLIEKSVHPDAIQIHGFLEEDFYKDVKDRVLTKIINGMPINKHNESQILDKNPLKAAKILQKYSDAILIDKYIPNKLGGTGLTIDWGLARKVRDNIDIPLILAGGLNENNIVEAIKIVNPYAVDISSGVEQSPGVKDPKKIINFIHKIKEANL
ncbi:MAG: phosphoribosylanthranilate isomerase [Candidatus Helarchaeota archaeon]|nr:phosphoribosylanthranilate isomerase [Candidatus Helarchaeota archaeon]